MAILRIAFAVILYKTVETARYKYKIHEIIFRSMLLMSAIVTFWKISRCGRIRQRIVLKCVPHVQHDYSFSFNQSDHCFLALSLPLPSFLLSINQSGNR